MVLFTIYVIKKYSWKWGKVHKPNGPHNQRLISFKVIRQMCKRPFTYYVFEDFFEPPTYLVFSELSTHPYVTSVQVIFVVDTLGSY